MFPMESDSTYNKFAQTESSFMDAYFNGNSVEKINFWPETNSTFTPLYLAKRNSYYLKRFRWYGDIRPMSPEDVFVVPEGMVELMNSAVEESKASKSRKEQNKRRPGGTPAVSPAAPKGVAPLKDVTSIKDIEPVQPVEKE